MRLCSRNSEAKGGRTASGILSPAHDLPSVRRCRPLLGTFVEITATGPDAVALARTVDAAFAAIERVQVLMSAHDPASELSRVNAGAHRDPVTVSVETFDVLERGLEIARVSDGAFDFTVAPVLANWGLLPAALRRRAGGDWRDVSLRPHRCIRFTRPLAIDLGGIAKGVAVDAAIATLRAGTVVSAVVNAGGDLRVFGPGPSRVHLRRPDSARPFAEPFLLRDAALATSSPCFSRRRWRGRTISHLVDPGTGRALSAGISVSVCARECWLADALTKVVLNAPRLAERVLERYEAEAVVVKA